MSSSQDSRRSAALVGLGILLSRLAGLLRERVIAKELGVGPAVDAFRAAVRIPNLLQNLLGEGVLSASFIPVYARLLAEGDEEEAGRVAGAVAGLLSAVAGVTVVVGVVLARPLTALIAPGFSGERYELTVTLVRIVTPGIGLLALSAWCLGVLNSHRRFFLAYVAPVVWNGAQIAVLTGLALRGFDQASLAQGLAWGVLVGGFLQLVIQLPAVSRLVKPLRLSVRTDRASVKAVLRRFGPAVAGRGVVQLSAYVDLVLASFLAVGALSALGYAQVLYLLPISLFGMSVAAAELPSMSSLDLRDRGPFVQRVEEGLGRIAFFVAPVSAAYLVLGDLVVAVLLQTGEFGAGETLLVWYVLGAFTLGLLATTSSRLLQSALYALGDTRTPAIVAAVRVSIAAVLGVIFMFQLDRIVIRGTGFGDLSGFGQLPSSLLPLPAELRTDGGRLRLGAVGLALASAVGAWIELVLLRRRVRTELGPVKLGGRRLAVVLTASFAALVVALGLRQVVSGFHPLAVLTLAGLPAAMVYLIITGVGGVPDVKHIMRSLHRSSRS